MVGKDSHTKSLKKEWDKMEKLQRIEDMIKEATDFEELVERLFWEDIYIIDDGQWLQDTNQGKIYGHTLHYYMTIEDLMGTERFKLYVEDDLELIDELDTI